MRKRIILTYLLLISCHWAFGEQSHQYVSYTYEVARAHEIKPHRLSIPTEGAGPGYNQLHLKLIVSPSGKVIGADADADSKILALWPQVRNEIVHWRFAPFVQNNKSVTAEVEEYVDLVPPEKIPSKHVAQPALHRGSAIEVTLARSGCFGSCPSYTVTISNQRIVFEGNSFVVAKGKHTAVVDPDKVQELAANFLAADFYSMDSTYSASVTDCPTYTLTISIDGHKKTVQDYVGQWVGMPSVIITLEEDVDALARTSRWTEGSEGLVKALREENFNFKTATAQNILTAAAERGQSGTVSELLDAGVPIAHGLLSNPKNVSRAFQFQPVGLLTAAADHTDVLRILIAARASEQDQNDKDSALVNAARSGNLESVKALIAYGANPNADLSHLIIIETSGPLEMQHRGSGNVLFYAAESGSPGVVREILRYHPDVNTRGENGQTSLFAAGEYRNGDTDGARAEILRLLCAAGANVNARDNDGNTPLHETFQADVEEELLKLGADVNAKNNDGETPIFTTVDNSAILLFVEHGADLSLRNNKGQTVVEASVNEGPIRQEALRKAMLKTSTP